MSSGLSDLASAIDRYPNCRIANCDCNEHGGVWKKGCHCLGHAWDMDAMFGKDKWTLSDFNRQAEGRDGKLESEPSHEA